MEVKLSVVWILLYLWSMVDALLNPTDLPQGLKDCFEMKTKYTSVKEVPSNDICITCITDYLWKQGRKHCYNSTEHDLTWVGEILTELHPVTSRRYKRVAPNQRRKRKEYRKLTDQEREAYHLAINKMKKDTRVKPNRYDAFVIFHSGMAGKSAHRGPNFMGWHRILLLMYEHSLNKMVRGVTLPYWDSTLDSAMSIDPVNSIIWSKHFMGNGDGQVQSGPFSHWINVDRSPLVRNIGSTGQLFTKRTVLNVLSKRYNHEIVEPSYNPLHSLEGLHDQVHKWVGGNMFDLLTAPMDPIFFMHHAYVDCIWETFRKQQIGYRIDPSKDYPKTKNALHHPDRYMDNLPPIPGFGKLRNKDGLLAVWHDKFYFYDQPPTCSYSNPDCDSKWLECDTRKKLCVAKSIQAMSFQYPTFQAFNPWVFWKQRGKRDTLGQIYGGENEYIHPYPAHVSYEKLKLPVPNELILGSPVQNIFEIDCVEDIRAWAFMAVKVIHIRPPEVKSSSRIVEHGVYTGDLYNESSYRSLRGHIKPGSPAMHSNCMEDKSGAFRVSLTSYGLSYSGWYEDYTVVDNRLPISSHTGYVAFKRPVPNTKEVVKTFITATDTCGRMCKARCLRITTSGRKVYVPCDGVVEASNTAPLMFSKSYGDAIREIWDFSDPDVPISDEKNIFMVFYCDYSDTWPWESCNKNKG